MSSPLAVEIEVPLGELHGGYHGRLVEFRLTSDEALVAARIGAGLKDSQALLANGRRVEHLADTFRWLLQQVATAAAAE